MKSHGPQPIGLALAELIAARGWAREAANEDLDRLWTEVAGEETARRTRVGAIKRGVLHVHVDCSALLSELASFRKDELLSELGDRRPELRLKNIKFRLRS